MSETAIPIAFSSGTGRAYKTIVTGPSLISSTAMRAPKTPVATATPRSRSAAQNASQSGSDSSGLAASPKLGRLPFAVWAMRVNWLTTSASPPTSSSERSKRPSSFSKIRSRAVLSARRAAPAASSARATPSRMQRPAPISPATSSPTRTRARETRCTTAFMFSARNDDITRVEAAHLPWQHLGSLLINRGLLTVEQVKQAFEEQRLTGRRLGEVAVGHGWVTGADLAKALADQFGVEYVDLSEVEPDRDAATLLQKELAFRYQALPIRFLANDLLLVAVADPTDVGRADDLRLALGHNVRLAVSEPNDLERAIKALYRTQIEVDEETGPDAEDAALEVAAERAEISEAAGETPAVKLVHTTLAQAIEDGASDIHFEPQERELIVRARIDGVTRAVATIPKQMQPAVVTRLKIMGRLDIAERRAPQDGRVSVRFGGEPLDLRVAVIPTTHGEQVVLRILHRAASKPDLEQLGMTPRVRELFERAIRQPYGAVVVCGPTGSGKTTTLYTALH